MPINIPTAPGARGESVALDPLRPQITPLSFGQDTSAPERRGIQALAETAFALGRTADSIDADRKQREAILNKANNERLATDAVTNATVEANQFYNNTIQSMQGENALPRTTPQGDPVPGAYQTTVDKMNEISTKHSTNLNPDSKLLFSESWMNTSSRLNIKASDHQSSENRSAIENTYLRQWDLMKSQAAANPGDSGHIDDLKARGQMAILGQAEFKGWSDLETEAELVRFDEDILTSSVRGRIDLERRNNPLRLWLDLKDGVYSPFLTEGELNEDLKDTVKVIEDEYDNRDTSRRIESGQRKEAAIASEIEVGETGIEAAEAGTLSAQWVNETNMTKAQRNRFNSILAGEDKGSDKNPATYELLAEQVDSVFDSAETTQIRLAISRAVTRGDISASEGNGLRDDLEKQTFGVAGSFLRDLLKPSVFNSDEFAKDRHGRAMLAWKSWKNRNRDATQAEALAEAELILEDANFFMIEAKRSAMGRMLPRFVERDKPMKDQNLDTVRANTVKHYMSKHGNDKAAVAADPAYREQVRSIELLEETKNTAVSNPRASSRK